MATHIVTDTERTINTAVDQATVMERIGKLRRFMQGCNPVLLRQIEVGFVELRRGADDQVRLVEGPSA